MFEWKSEECIYVMRNGDVLWLHHFAGTDGLGCVQSPVQCTNVEPLGLLLCYLHMMHRAVLIQLFQWPHIQINRRAWLNGDRALFALLAVTGTRTGKWSSWRMSSSKVFISCSCLWLFCKRDPPAPLPTQIPSALLEGSEGCCLPKIFPQKPLGQPVLLSCYSSWISWIFFLYPHPRVSLNFLQSLEGWVQNHLCVSGKLGKIRKCSEIFILARGFYCISVWLNMPPEMSSAQMHKAMFSAHCLKSRDSGRRDKYWDIIHIFWVLCCVLWQLRYKILFYWLFS